MLLKSSTMLVSWLFAVMAAMMLAAGPIGAQSAPTEAEKCNVPPVVSASTAKPNVLLVLDMGGSLQLSAYYTSPSDVLNADGTCTPSALTYYTSRVVNAATMTAAGAVYQPGEYYYGPFEPDVYYEYIAKGTIRHYWQKKTPQRELRYKGYIRSEKGDDACQEIEPYGKKVTECKTMWFGVRGIDGDSSDAGKIALPTWQVGDRIGIYGLTSHKSLDGMGLAIEAIQDAINTVTGSDGITRNEVYKRFKVRLPDDVTLQNLYYTWNGRSDSEAYTVVKRVNGDVAGGINGNILNFATTSRMDTIQKALIGGRAECSSSDPGYCQIRAQGASRSVSESTNLNTDFTVRPGTLPTSTLSDPMSDNLDAGTYWADAAGIARDIFFSFSVQYKGLLDGMDPKYGGEQIEPWKFTVPTLQAGEKVKVKFVYQGNWSAAANGGRLVLYRSYSNGNFSSPVSDSGSILTWPLTFEVEFDTAGTYYLRLATANNKPFADGVAVPTNTYTLWSNIKLEKFTDYHRAYDKLAYYDGTDTLSTIGAPSRPWYRLRIRVPSAERTGLVQWAFPLVRMGFMYYKQDINQNDNIDNGALMVGLHNTDMDVLINALQGVGGNCLDTDGDGSPNTDKCLDFTRVYPWGDQKPLFRAIQETEDYFERNANSSNVKTAYFNKDVTNCAFHPFKEKIGVSGGYNVCSVVKCRKSFGLLFSDGMWTKTPGADPVMKIAGLHTEDLYGDATDGEQTIDFYSILGFSQCREAENAMKYLTMYGSYKPVHGCSWNKNWPYPEISTPKEPGSGSSYVWPPAECDANVPAPSGHSYNATCCAQWDKQWDRDGDGIYEQKGTPDNYFHASRGKEVLDSLRRVLEEIMSRHASAGAVATVSQELSTGDIIIRGVFDAVDPDVSARYLWYGHLEAYWPFQYGETEKYDFEIPENQGLLCVDIPVSGASGKHCWDSGYYMSTKQEYSASTSERTIYTWNPTTKSQYEFNTTNIGAAQIYGASSTAETDADKVVKWVLGDSPCTGCNQRNRATSKAGGNQWILGDIVYSTPVVIGPPRLGDVSVRDPDHASFLDYRNRNVTKSKVVIVGANDGMVHAFLLAKYEVPKSGTDEEWISDPAKDAATESNIGKELWAFIPSNLLTELQHLAKDTYGTESGCKHRTMVDLSPRAWEVYIKSPTCARDSEPTGEAGRCWRTVVVGGERGGGDVFFAIDVSDPFNPVVLWEYSVLQNRVVVDAPTTSSAQWVADCKAACPDRTCPSPYTSYCCRSEYDLCKAACPASPPAKKNDRDACIRICDRAKTNCIGDCEDYCTQSGLTQPPTNYAPFRGIYESIKLLPMSWSQPYLGRMQFPYGSAGVKFYIGEPDAGGNPQTLVQFETGVSDATTTSTKTLNYRRSVAFMGGGVHYFDTNFSSLSQALEEALFEPFLIVMDIETGYNLFEYVWPLLFLKMEQANLFPKIEPSGYKGQAGATKRIPYLLSDPLALDVWREATQSTGDDGFIDRVYVGDMNGYLYGIKFMLDATYKAAHSTSQYGMQVDLWPTKPIYYGATSNNYRGDRQPITVQPVATFEKRETTLHVVFGTGKYDDVYTSQVDDKTDTSRMSLYNVADSAGSLPTLSTTDTLVYSASYNTNFYVKFNKKCAADAYNVARNYFRESGCKWYDKKTVGSDIIMGDCCQSDATTNFCVNPCYKCVYDLTFPIKDGTKTNERWENTGGERIVGKPLIAGGLVFVTSFVPPDDPCNYSGAGYLYIFDVFCNLLVDPYKIVPGAIEGVDLTYLGGDSTRSEGIQLALGRGMPSRPVLDSRGENVIIQMSDGTLKRVGVDLPGKPIQVKGWRTTR